ncbi:phorbol esters/diacylglycerol binding domain protein [Teladorsagia circumcincta]|uniref:Phorbol esters/diacylglycerol binding domain protein n=1 Tax=Teladorsagia circumcincta TaxID=45464 RepID=A0A2G9UB81_TELCI|nr:phorbol esters/diacylglycerol binding domain protein [Teladorsagia circumcincta]
MRDADKLILDDHLHRVIMQHIDTLQRWFRTIIARKRYLRLKQGLVKIQVAHCSFENSFDANEGFYSGAGKGLGDIPRQRGRIRVKRVQAVKLPVFDLDNPQSLAVFGLSDDDDLESDEDDGESTQDGLDEDVSESSVLGDIDDEAIELDATFILEDTKLKLIEDSCDLASHRRQSLAPTASTAKLKMLRRANSTDSNTMVRPDDNFKPLQLGSPTAKKKTGSRMGFTKAKKNLKALFGRRSGSINEDDGVDMELPPRVQAMLPQGVFFVCKVSSLHSFVTDEIADEVQLTTTSMGHREERTVLKYRDLITTFEGVLTKVCKEEKVSFPTTLGVNAFRGFLNEFMQNQKKKGSKQKSGIIKVHAGHRFKADLVHVPTYCEVCNQFMWHAEKIFICMACRISCHKKCHAKITQQCSMMIAPSLSSASGGRFFGAVLATLVDEDHIIPPLVDRLFMNVETRALFVEGVYRFGAA